MLNHKAVKKWGQVFLKNENVKRRIASLVNFSEEKTVLEIGPGVGAITEYINFKDKTYWAVEIDKKLCNYLFCQYPEATFLNEDFLKIDLSSMNLENERVLLFGNIPYCITTPIFIKFLKTPQFNTAYFMVQKEYGIMLKAQYKTKQYSSFTVLIQACCEIKSLFEINRMNFFPKPKIDSLLVSIKKTNSKLLNNFDIFASFLRLCFSMPRKTLNNNLKKKLTKEEVDFIFLENKLSEKIRSEEISPQQFEEIFLSSSCQTLFEKFL